MGAGVSQALSQERIAFAEPDKILEALPEREQIEDQLEDFYMQWEEDFNEFYEEYSEELRQFQQNRNQMSQSQRQSEQRRLANMTEELNAIQQEFGMQFERRRAELLSPVIASINEAIEQIAEEMSLDYVLNRNTAELEPILFVMESNPNALNITERVIELLTQ